MKSSLSLVSIIMGSDSDLPVMAEAARVLEELEVAFEVTIVSAHRTPERLFGFSQSAQKRGIKVIIAGAGGAAHLPGMVASLSSLPVIGVPIHSKNLSGLDSLYSMVQMPPGIPVATVAINGAKNAGLLAARILAITDQTLADRLDVVTQDMKDSVLNKVKKIDEQGYNLYLDSLSQKS